MEQNRTILSNYKSLQVKVAINSETFFQPFFEKKRKIINRPFHRIAEDLIK